jgi:predicted TIM-barrel fold metal-dependent hydrolase
LITDINGYCGNWPYWPVKLTEGRGLVALLDRFRIDCVAVTSTKGAFVGCAEGNADTARIVQEHASRLIGFLTVSPTDGPQAVEQLRTCHAQGLKGLRLFPQHHLYRLDDDPVLAQILATAQELGLPVLIPVRLIMNWGMPTLDVREIGNIAGRYRHVRFIIGGVNYGEVRDALGVMRRNDNVSLETSCLQIHEGVATFVRQVGAERVYFGSGLPLQYPGPGLAKIQNAEISDDAKERILGGNARQLLALQKQGAA